MQMTQTWLRSTEGYTNMTKKRPPKICRKTISRLSWSMQDLARTIAPWTAHPVQLKIPLKIFSVDAEFVSVLQKNAIIIYITGINETESGPPWSQQGVMNGFDVKEKVNKELCLVWIPWKMGNAGACGNTNRPGCRNLNRAPSTLTLSAHQTLVSQLFIAMYLDAFYSDNSNVRRGVQNISIRCYLFQ
jgi:hypothetical protein